jgi:hypothetical protein
MSVADKGEGMMVRQQAYFCGNANAQGHCQHFSLAAYPRRL